MTIPAYAPLSSTSYVRQNSGTDTVDLARLSNKVVGLTFMTLLEGPDLSCMYRVQEGETLYSISNMILSKRLGRDPIAYEIEVYVQEIRKANEGITDGIHADDLIMLPHSAIIMPKSEAVLAEVQPVPQVIPSIATPLKQSPFPVSVTAVKPAASVKPAQMGEKTWPLRTVGDETAPLAKKGPYKPGALMPLPNAHHYPIAAPGLGIAAGVAADKNDETVACRVASQPVVDYETGNVTYSYQGELRNSFLGLFRAFFVATETLDSDGNLLHSKIEYDGFGTSIKFLISTGNMALQLIRKVETRYDAKSDLYSTVVNGSDGTKHTFLTLRDGSKSWIA